MSRNIAKPAAETAAQAAGSPIASANPIPHRPEFVRLPRPGTLCVWTGLSRSKLNELILPMPLNNFRPLVKSIVLRNKGRQRGVRLIVFEDLIRFLHAQNGLDGANGEN